MKVGRFHIRLVQRAVNEMRATAEFRSLTISFREAFKYYLAESFRWGGKKFSFPKPIPKKT